MALRKCVVTFCASIALCAMSPAFADFAETFDGALASTSPQFDRPGGGGPGTTGPVYYDVQGFYLGSDSSCYVVGAQDYDGYLDLYAGSWDPAFPLTNLIAWNDDGLLGIGTSFLPSGADSIALSAGAYYLVTSSFDSLATGSFQNTIHCDGAQPTQGISGTYFPAVPVEQQVFLGNAFPVYIAWQTNGASGTATPVRSGSIDTAKFWFFNNTNWEVMIKILNACAINGHYWVFFAALTNQGFTVHIGYPFTMTPLEYDYSNAIGHPADTVLDTNAMPCP